MIKGLDRLKRQLQELADLDWVAAEVEGMNIIAEEARNLVPVDTGDLQDTIGVEVDGDVVQLVAGGGGVPVDYALYVEMGTSRMAAQPYMRPAIDTKNKEASRAIANNLEAQMKKVANG